MALTVFLCGHGEWKPNDGYVQMPKGCSMTFIVHVAKTLPTKDMFTVCGGTYPNQPDRIVREYHSCPNMTWKVDDPDKIDICKALAARNVGAQPAEVVFPNNVGPFLDAKGSIKLRKFFEDLAPTIHGKVTQHQAVNFIWASCFALKMNRTERGGDIGVNALQKVNAYIHMDRTVIKSGIPIGWSEL